MFRGILVALCVMGLALPAFGYEIEWELTTHPQIQVILSVDCYIQIYWLDPEIHFNQGTGPDTTWDFWATQLAIPSPGHRRRFTRGCFSP